MSWNLFLAWVPLLFSIIILSFNDNKNHSASLKVFVTIFLGIPWLLFFPNSAYIITDFIHIGDNFQILKNVTNELGEIERIFVFNDNFEIWLNFVGIAVGVFLGFANGVMSLFINEENIRKKFGKACSVIFVIIVQILTGYAITIGRFQRWNSWDVFIPSNIIKIIKGHMNIQSLKFTVLFSILSFISYFSIILIIRSFMPNKKKS